MPNWRSPPVVTTECWRGACKEDPVAERPQVIQSPLRGTVVTWRGFCPEHILPLWVEEGTTYHWMLRPISVGQLQPGTGMAERTEDLIRRPHHEVRSGCSPNGSTDDHQPQSEADHFTTQGLRLTPSLDHDAAMSLGA